VPFTHWTLRKLSAYLWSPYRHGCYDLSQDKPWGALRRRRGGDHTPSALRTIRAARPDDAPLYVIMDDLSANKTPAPRARAAAHDVGWCFTPTSASWADPGETRSGPLRTFTIAGSDCPNHVVLGRGLHAYLRWRNADTRRPDVLAARRRERLRRRRERHQRWGRPHDHAA
jgi:hypothetical protein